MSLQTCSFAFAKKRSRVSASQPVLSGPNETTTAPLRQGEIQDDSTRDPAIVLKGLWAFNKAGHALNLLDIKFSKF